MSKLTITLPDELRRRAEARATLEVTTLAEVIRQQLEQFAAGLEAIEEAEDLRVTRDIEARLARGEEPVADWEDVKAELDALPD